MTSETLGKREEGIPMAVVGDGRWWTSEIQNLQEPWKDSGPGAEILSLSVPSFEETILL